MFKKATTITGTRFRMGISDKSKRGGKSSYREREQEYMCWQRIWTWWMYGDVWEKKPFTPTVTNHPCSLFLWQPSKPSGGLQDTCRHILCYEIWINYDIILIKKLYFIKHVHSAFRMKMKNYYTWCEWIILYFLTGSDSVFMFTCTSQQRHCELTDSVSVCVLQQQLHGPGVMNHRGRMTGEEQEPELVLEMQMLDWLMEMISLASKHTCGNGDFSPS